MGFYELVIVIAVVLLLSPLWTVFSYTTNIMTADFVGKNITGAPADYDTELNLYNDIQYFSWFFIIIVLFVWVIKKSGQEQDNSVYG